MADSTAEEAKAAQKRNHDAFTEQEDGECRQSWQETKHAIDGTD